MAGPSGCIAQMFMILYCVRKHTGCHCTVHSLFFPKNMAIPFSEITEPDACRYVLYDCFSFYGFHVLVCLCDSLDEEGSRYAVACWSVCLIDCPPFSRHLIRSTHLTSYE